MLVNFCFNLSTSIRWSFDTRRQLRRVQILLCALLFEKTTQSCQFFILNRNEPQKREKWEYKRHAPKFQFALTSVTRIMILRSSVTSVPRKHQHTLSYRFLQSILDFRLCNRCRAPHRAQIPLVHSILKNGVIFLDYSHLSHLKIILYFLTYNTCLILTEFSDCRTPFLTLLITTHLQPDNIDAANVTLNPPSDSQ